ncbi:MAG: fused MFS/spermidine synthase [Terriglobales bacterium]|jgi:spermidine synthase/MFS family permease
MAWYFVFFFVSGFCSILYELIWLRLAMAQFSVTTAFVSIVLSMFMAGLGIGSVAAGTWIRRHGGEVRISPLRLYALTELLIGVSALAVPLELGWGHRILQAIAAQGTLSSGLSYVVSGAWMALTLVPWCACMGATIPVAMFAIRNDARCETRRSFSFLYLANVLGAVAGATVPLFLIELYGFHGTLRVGALLNAAIAASAMLVSLASRGRAARTDSQSAAAVSAEPVSAGLDQRKSVLALLFMTGLVTMGMEVVWIRLFTPYLGAIVYAFAGILASYLLATFAGSRVYRVWSRSHDQESRLAWISLALLGLLPLLTADSRVHLVALHRVFLGVMPVSAVIGFLTPMLVDRWSGGDPDRAGRAYAVNVVGCIAGPLVSGFILLPLAGEHLSLLLFVLPWFLMALPSRGTRAMALAPRAATAAILLAAIVIFLLTQDYETQFPKREVLRDSTATVIAAEVPADSGTGTEKQLLVNGVGMTSLTPITKMMAHFPLASLDHAPREALVICFGMGTTFRSALSWGIPVTAVDLVPSVPKLFHFFHGDAAQVLASPQAHIVADDGRHYLERNPGRYDVIMIDPPPPVQAAGSSLLYSQDFYAVVRERLRPGGILAQWLPAADDAVQASVARALKNSFPYVRVFPSVEHWGWHFFASDRSIQNRSAADLVARMPAKAVADMMEWGPAKTADEQYDLMLSAEMTTEQMIALASAIPALQDDRPINEYYLLRKPRGDVGAKVRAAVRKLW